MTNPNPTPTNLRLIKPILARYNSPLVDHAADFVKFGRRYKIKPELVLAICGAESSFGKHLTTPFNPGNVGNNDAGQKVTFKSWRTGIEAIYQVLNFPHLKPLKEVWQLSTGGKAAHGKPPNDNIPVYATSDHDWNLNVCNFLSEFYYGDFSHSHEFLTFNFRIK